MATRIADKIAKLVRAKMTDEQIALAVDRSVRTVANYRRDMAPSPRPNAARPSQDLIDKIRALSSEEGWPPSEISKTLGISIAQAHRWSIRGPGAEWNRVARWAARWHRTLWEELQ